MKRLLVALPFLFALPAEAQECSDALLLQKPGIWKEGMKGSVAGVPVASLAAERKVVAAIHGILRQNYAPMGLEALHAAAYQRPYPETLAYWYQYTIYLMPYTCRGGAVKTAEETNSSLVVHANAMDIQFSHDIASGFLDDADKNHYGWLKKMPVWQDGAWYFGEIEVTGGFGVKVKEHKWLIVYDGKLPFQYVTRKEYLVAASAIFQKLRRIELKRIDEKLTADKREHDRAYASLGKRYDDMLGPIERLAKTLTADALREPAIVSSMSDFTEFLKEGDRAAMILVKENPDYYDKTLAKAAPQLFAVVMTIDDRRPVFVQAYADMRKALGFASLKAMLGSAR